MPYTIDIPSSTEEDVEWLSVRDQRIVLDEINTQLSYQPTVPTKKRKPLRIPNSLNAEWELRVGLLRVFYNIRGNTIAIVAVGYKPGSDLYVGGGRLCYESCRT